MLSPEDRGLQTGKLEGPQKGMFFPTKTPFSHPSAPPPSLSLKSAAQISICGKVICALLSLLLNANNPEAL